MFGHFEGLAVPLMPDANRNDFETARTVFGPLLTELDTIAQEVLLPAIDEHESLLLRDDSFDLDLGGRAGILDGLALPRLALMWRVRDSAQVVTAFARARVVTQRMLTSAAALNGREPIDLEAPQVRAADSGTMYSYALPGMPAWLQPCILINGEKIVFSLTPVVASTIAATATLLLGGPAGERCNADRGSAAPGGRSTTCRGHSRRTWNRLSADETLGCRRVGNQEVLCLSTMMPQAQHNLLGLLAVTAAVSTSGDSRAQSWVPRSAAPTSAPVFRHAPFVHDAARGRTIWFAGTFDETPNAQTVPINEHWEFDGQVWLQAQPRQMAPPRYNYATCYDSLRQRVMIFGGRNVPYVDRTDLWSFQNGTWTQIQTVTTPPGRRSAAMAYDVLRDRVVLFGGVGSVYYDDTWEFDGTDWQQVAASGPTVRSNAAMAFDPIRGRCVMTGGYNPGQGGLNTTWEFDGQSWTAGASVTNINHLAFDPNAARVVSRAREWDGSSWVPSTAAAPFFANEGLVYDATLQTRLAFGTSNAIGSNLIVETFVQSGAKWRSMLIKPPSHWLHDPIRQRMLAIGVFGAGNTATWDGHDLTVVPGSAIEPFLLWSNLTFDTLRDEILTVGSLELRRVDGSTLQQLAPIPTPFGTGNGTGGSIVYDAQRNRLVVAFLYQPGIFQPSVFQTWEYDGSAWQQILTPTVPPSVAHPSLVYDSARQRVVMTGGFIGLLQPFNQTWEYEGVDWQQITTNNHPSYASPLATATYDSVRSLVVARGGPHTWTYDGVDWQIEWTTPNLAKPSTAAFDPLRNRIVGVDDRIFEYGFAGLPQVTAFGNACQNSSETMDLVDENAPTVGKTMRLRLNGLPPEPGLALILTGFDDQQTGGAPLPLALSAIGGPPGCELALDLAFANSVLHQGSTATFSFALPPSPSIVGAIYFQQGAVLDPMLNVPLPIATSNALRLTAGW